MTDQSLREALEKLVEDYATIDTEWIREALAAHPVEPAGCAACISGDTENCTCFAIAPVQVEITDEVPDTVTFAAVRAFHKRPGYSELERMRDALMAAAPLLGPRPLLDREAVKAVLAKRLHGEQVADLLMELARPMPTEAEIGHALNLHWWDEDERPCACGFDFIAAGQSFKMHLAGVFAALLNGTES